MYIWMVGNDDPSSPNNEFTVAGLDTMGRFSQLAKAVGGYIVSMAPAGRLVEPGGVIAALLIFSTSKSK